MSSNSISIEEFLKETSKDIDKAIKAKKKREVIVNTSKRIKIKFQKSTVNTGKKIKIKF